MQLCNDAFMRKARTTVTLDEDVFKAVKIKAARTGKRDSQVIEESLRRDLGLDDLAALWAEVTPVSEDEGLKLAYEELHEMREERRAEGGP
jgi:gamma-glutamyl:cysteine ligase YbdK (ATP-grasp superfamily)